MKSITIYFFNKLYAFDEAVLTRKALALFALYKCLFWIIDYHLLFPEQSMVYKHLTFLSVWQWPAFILYRSHSAVVPMLFLGLVIIMALYILFSKKTFRLASFILWICVVNIINNTYCATTAGEMLFQHLLFFCVFLSDGTSKANLFWNEVDAAFHNSGMIAMRLQVCLVYFYAALAKLFDQEWLNGDAVNMTLAVHDYSLPALYGGLGSSGKTLAYLVLAYQLFFPVLVWFKRIKKWYLLIGILQHLFIAFVIGLPSFGLIMILSYAVFYSPFKKT